LIISTTFGFIYSVFIPRRFEFAALQFNHQIFDAHEANPT